MDYYKKVSNYIKNICLERERIGKTTNTVEIFNTIENYFSGVTELDYTFDYTLTKLNKDLEEDRALRNKVGDNFKNTVYLITKSKYLSNLIKATNGSTIRDNFTDNQRNSIELLYAKIAEKYGLLEFYYVYDKNLSKSSNHQKAIELGEIVRTKLENLSTKLSINNMKIGNNILRIEVNSQEDKNDISYFNCLEDKIVLRDEKTTLPLEHEFMHFIDKTIFSLLITGKSPRQLYEQTNIDTFKIIKYFNLCYIKEVESLVGHIDGLSGYIKNIGYDKYKNKHQQKELFTNKSKEFKTKFIEWIENKYPNDLELKNNVEKILNKKTSYDKLNIHYEDKIKQEIINKAIYSVENKIFHHKKWGELFDNNNDKLYYNSEKETIARIFQTITNKSANTLTDTITTPTIKKELEVELLMITKKWLEFISKTIEEKEKTVEKIQAIRLKSTVNILNKLNLKNK